MGFYKGYMLLRLWMVNKMGMCMLKLCFSSGFLKYQLQIACREMVTRSFVSTEKRVRACNSD
jgi:hypothetical protein